MVFEWLKEYRHVTVTSPVSKRVKNAKMQKKKKKEMH